jgi:hypothetical protein
MGVWSYHFVDVQTHDGRKLRLMTLIDEFTRSPPFGASANLTIPCHTGHAVQIEPKVQSPKSGNISNIPRRLSPFSPQSCAKLETGTGCQFEKTRYWREFMRFLTPQSPVVGLPSWGGRIRTLRWWIESKLTSSLLVSAQKQTRPSGLSLEHQRLGVIQKALGPVTTAR